jgi:DNA-binding transcriptional regulator YiaG
MPITRKTWADIDREKLLADLAAARVRTEEEIEAEAIEDDSVLTDEDLEAMVPAYPPPQPEEIRAMRTKLGLSQSQFALMFGFNVDTWQQYEQGRRVPRGPASTLLHVIAREPEAVLRALDPRRAREFAKRAAAE